VILYDCNKGHKMGTLFNPMHWILHVHALGSRVFNYWRFVIDLKASSPTPPIWASSVFTKSLVSPNYSPILTHEHERVDDTHWEIASANKKESFFSTNPFGNHLLLCIFTSPNSVSQVSYNHSTMAASTHVPWMKKSCLKIPCFKWNTSIESQFFVHKILFY
jgi:hypothetical protein